MDQNVLRAARGAAIDLHKSGRLDEAQKAYTAYLQYHPRDSGVWINLGVLFRTKGQHQMARAAQKRAYELSPDASGVVNNYANILLDTGAYDASIALRQTLLADKPSDLMQHAMIGRCLRGKGDYAAAIDYLGPKSVQYPQEAEMRLQLAFAQFGAGQLGAGFRSYDARWETTDISPPDAPFPKWSEGQPIAGKTILVFPEQGFGDMVLMSRFIPLIAAKGARVRLVAKKPLLRLLQGIDGVSWIGEAARATDPVDFWVSLMDLPKLVYAADEPGAVPPPSRLRIPEDAVARARSFTEPFRDRFKIGVVWNGSTTYKANGFRSFSHQAFLPLTELPAVQLFSLYKGPGLVDFHADGSSALIVDTASTDRDFADCAATMQQMDLIITSDTATAHIAGSLGLPTWVLLHWDAFWVYRHHGEQTEWYPTMRLFRQPAPMDWPPVFSAVETALSQQVAGHG